MNIAAELEKHAGEELAHALILSNQIDYLGGMPTTVPKPVKTSEKAEDMLRFDLDNENETIRNYVVQAQKTWRKHKAAMILATQSIKELEESGMLAIVAESCPTKIFLANPEMNREVYREAFHLNDTELDLIAGLVPPGQMLIRKAQTSKKVQLNVDSVSHWMATNNARDNLKKREYFERFGFADGLRHLAEDYPFQPRTLALSTVNTNH